MSSYKTTYVIKCRDDCSMSGCPTHTIRIEANNTSDAMSYYKDEKHKFDMDFDELKEFIKTVADMGHWTVEIDRIFEEIMSE